MTVLSVVEGAVWGVLKVGLSDGSSFFLRSDYLEDPSSPPAVGEDLDEESERALRAAGTATLVESVALRLIAGREHSRRALAVKLLQRGFPEEALRAPLDRLQAKGLLDDRRFAELWLSSRLARRAEGPVKLVAGLRARGVSREDASAALRAVLDAETELSLARRFLEQLAPTEDSRRKLREAGFSSDAIRSILEE